MKYSPRITTKLFSAATIVLLLAASAFIYVAQRTGSRLLEQQVESKAYSISQFGSTLLEHFMLEGRHDQVTNLLRSGVVPKQVVELFVLRNDGSVAFSSDTSAGKHVALVRFKRNLMLSEVQFFSQEENDALYEYVLSPVVKKTGCYRCHTNDEHLRGYFGVKVSMADLVASARQHRTTNMLMTLLAFLSIGAAILFAIMVFVTRPLSRLQTQIASTSTQIELVEQGKQLHLVPLDQPSSNDEIGNVILAFNKLVVKLDQAYQSVRRLHQLELQQADRLTSAGQMAATMAHEIRNPLAGVLAALQVLEADTPRDNPKKKIMTEMIAQLQTMNDSLNDLLAYAKPSAPIFQEVDINEIIEKDLTLVMSRTDAQVIKVDKRFDRALPPIFGDRKLLQQLFWNIVQNALQAMNAGGTLTIRTQHTNGALAAMFGGEVRVDIHDTGIGIPSSDQENLFKPFYTTKHKGTGLGLAVSKQIVEQHHGSISMESQNGQGTSVTILLPIQISERVI